MAAETKNDSLYRNVRYFARWVLTSVIMGISCGLVGTLFGYGVQIAARIFNQEDKLLWFMPLAGIVIVGIHSLFGQLGNKGTNTVIESISSNEKIRFSLFPCMFISTILTQLVGGSAGKEGAALQIGGCIGSKVGEILKLDEKDKKIAIMCGMSGCFAAIFGTPLAAAAFGMEMITVGVLYYAALVPCVFSAFIGSYVSSGFGLYGEQFGILAIPDLTPYTAMMIIIMAALAAVASMLFCVILHKSNELYAKYFKNPYIRILAASGLMIAMTYLTGTRAYSGGGFNIVQKALLNPIVPYAFLFKMIFTGMTLGGGFKGGEIVPTLAVGAAFGSAFGGITGFCPSLCAACGMLSLFVGVTNCPVATIFLGFELFGFEAMPFFALAIAVSFTFSGYYGLYSSQKFTYSKTKTEYINRIANH